MERPTTVFQARKELAVKRQHAYKVREHAAAKIQDWYKINRTNKTPEVNDINDMHCWETHADHYDEQLPGSSSQEDSECGSKVTEDHSALSLDTKNKAVLEDVKHDLLTTENTPDMDEFIKNEVAIALAMSNQRSFSSLTKSQQERVQKLKSGMNESLKTESSKVSEGKDDVTVPEKNVQRSPVEIQMRKPSANAESIAHKSPVERKLRKPSSHAESIAHKSPTESQLNKPSSNAESVAHKSPVERKLRKPLSHAESVAYKTPAESRPLSSNPEKVVNDTHTSPTESKLRKPAANDKYRGENAKTVNKEVGGHVVADTSRQDAAPLTKKHTQSYAPEQQSREVRAHAQDTIRLKEQKRIGDSHQQNGALRNKRVHYVEHTDVPFSEEQVQCVRDSTNKGDDQFVNDEKQTQPGHSKLSKVSKDTNLKQDDREPLHQEEKLTLQKVPHSKIPVKTKHTLHQEKSDNNDSDKETTKNEHSRNKRKQNKSKQRNGVKDRRLKEDNRDRQLISVTKSTSHHTQTEWSEHEHTLIPLKASTPLNKERTQPAPHSLSGIEQLTKDMPKTSDNRLSTDKETSHTHPLSSNRDTVQAVPSDYHLDIESKGDEENESEEFDSSHLSRESSCVSQYKQFHSETRDSTPKKSTRPSVLHEPHTVKDRKNHKRSHKIGWSSDVKVFAPRMIDTAVQTDPLDSDRCSSVVSSSILLPVADNQGTRQLFVRRQQSPKRDHVQNHLQHMQRNRHEKMPIRSLKTPVLKPSQKKQANGGYLKKFLHADDHNGHLKTKSAPGGYANHHQRPAPLPSLTNLSMPWYGGLPMHNTAPSTILGGQSPLHIHRSPLDSIPMRRKLSAGPYKMHVGRKQHRLKPIQHHRPARNVYLDMSAENEYVHPIYNEPFNSLAANYSNYTYNYNRR